LDVASRLRALSRELSTLADADGRAAGSPRHTIALISDALNAACGLNICNINV
jgi:hypothetical protein